MWDWLTGNLRRRSRRRERNSATSEPRETTATNDQIPSTSGLEASNFFNRTRFNIHPFFKPTGLSSQPKCTRLLPCSQILYGERLEDFSTDCWLEDHLHRFGFPGNEVPQNFPSTSAAVFEEDSDDSISSMNDSISDNFFFQDERDSDNVPVRPRLALEELFMPHVESDTDVDAGYNFVDIPDDIEPPPYTEYEYPPPSYEEAVGEGRTSRRSTMSARSGRFPDLNQSSSSSAAFMW